MLTLDGNYLVKKRNVFNELRSSGMTLQELRFFSIYLSRINPEDVSTRVVRFLIADFISIMNLSRVNLEYMKQVTNGLLCKVVNVPNERGGYIGFQIFKECRVDVDKNNEWYIEIDANDKALPLMFEFKEKYFSYRLWNALRLKSSNQLRMYEILKQYEKIGERVLSVDELKGLLGIDTAEYARYSNFRERVLNVCQQALAGNTDISFTYEPHGKKGRGGKIRFLKFTIQKNEEYKDPLTLEHFIKLNAADPDSDCKPSIYDERMSFLAEACENEFSIFEIIVLYNIMTKRMPYERIRDNGQCYDFLKSKYDEMNMRDKKNKISHRFAYMKTLVGAE